MQSRTQTQGLVSPTFSLGLYTSVNIIKRILHRHATGQPDHGNPSWRLFWSDSRLCQSWQFQWPISRCPEIPMNFRISLPSLKNDSWDCWLDDFDSVGHSVMYVTLVFLSVNMGYLFINLGLFYSTIFCIQSVSGCPGTSLTRLASNPQKCACPSAGINGLRNHAQHSV